MKSMLRKTLQTTVQPSGKLGNTAIQDDRVQSITNTRLKRILLNNPNFTLSYNELEAFLRSKIDFGKYKSGAVRDYIEMRKFDDLDLRKIKGLKSFDGTHKLEDFYDFSGKMVKFKDQWRIVGKKTGAADIVRDIIRNNRDSGVAEIFVVGEDGFTWEQILKKDSKYFDALIERFDFSDPSKNKQLMTYYANKSNIESYLAGELSPEDIRLPFKNSLASFELEVGIPSYKHFLDKFKETGFTFIDTETTRLDHTIGSLLSFGYVKVTYDKTAKSFVIADQGEIFVQDMKEPVSEFSAHGGVFGKYSGNKITEEVLKEKGLHPNEAAEEIKKIMHGGILMAHNASFDNGVLNTFFNDLKAEVPRTGKFYDTYTDAFPFFFRAIPKYRDMSKLGLDSIAEKVLGKNVKEDAERHTALKDALWCSEIILALINEPEIKKGFEEGVDEDEFNGEELRLF